METNQAIARRKGRTAAAVAAAGVVMLLLKWPVLGVVTLGAGVYLGYRWFKFRAERGMRL
jgi:hypothetical protein